MPTRNINLTGRLDRFIEKEVASGEYGNASEVVREGLRLLETRKAENRAKLQWLRGAVQESIDELERGEGIVFESADEAVRFIDRLAEEASARIGERRKRA